MQHSRDGFTLIEFIIVLAIVGLFLAITIPAYKRHYDRKQPSCSDSDGVPCAQKEQRFSIQKYDCDEGDVSLITDMKTGEQWIFYRGVNFNGQYFGMAPVSKPEPLDKPE